MINNQIKIYLVTPNDITKYKVKIVWAGSEEEARIAAENPIAKRKEPGDEIPMLKLGVYFEETTKCENIANNIKYTELNDSVHLEYQDKQFVLVKGIAVDVNRSL